MLTSPSDSLFELKLAGLCRTKKSEGKVKLKKTFLMIVLFVKFDVQSPSHAYKRFRSIIRKLAVVFLFVKIQNILIRNVWKTQKFAISLSIRTFKILKVTRILG